MSPEDWKEMDKRLRCIGVRVSLKVDGYNVIFFLDQVKQFKNRIVVYVNDIINWSWCRDGSEEARRFYHPKKVFLHSPKNRKALKKIPKKYRTGLDPDASFIHREPFWDSFRALKKHLLANNESIELVREAS